jgi:hypothetical protein
VGKGDEWRTPFERAEEVKHQVFSFAGSGHGAALGFSAHTIRPVSVHTEAIPAVRGFTGPDGWRAMARARAHFDPMHGELPVVRAS